MRSRTNMFGVFSCVGSFRSHSDVVCSGWTCRVWGGGPSDVWAVGFSDWRCASECGGLKGPCFNWNACQNSYSSKIPSLWNCNFAGFQWQCLSSLNDRHACTDWSAMWSCERGQGFNLSNSLFSLLTWLSHSHKMKRLEFWKAIQKSALLYPFVLLIGLRLLTWLSSWRAIR